MGDSNHIYETILNKFDGSLLLAANDPQDEPSADDDDPEDDWQDYGHLVVQFLAISANFPVCAINAYDGEHGHCIYASEEDDDDAQVLQEDDGIMVDLVPIGPSELVMPFDAMGLEIFYYTTAPRDSDSVVGEHDHQEEGGLRPLGPSIIVHWQVHHDAETTKGYTRTITDGPDRKLEITYLVIPTAIQTSFEVSLKLKDLGGGSSRSRAVYGEIKATATDYMNRRVHLFCCGRRRCLPVPSGGTAFVLPLTTSKIALPCSGQLEFDIEVDLTVITRSTCDESREDDDDKKLKFTLLFDRGMVAQGRGVGGGDCVRVEVKYESEFGL